MVCGEMLGNECIKLSHIRPHLTTKHTELKEKTVVRVLGEKEMT